MKKSLKLHFIFKIVAVAGQFGDHVIFWRGFPCGSVGKESACNAGDLSLVPELGRCPGERNNPPVFWPGLFHGIGHGITKSQTQLSDFYYILDNVSAKLWC